MSVVLTERDLARLDQAHEDLQRVFITAAKISNIPFTILEVLRNLERQKKLFAQGATKTMKSRHLPGANGLSHAVDAAPMIDGQVSWDWPLYHKLAKFIKQAAEMEGVEIEWGGDWKTFKDGPHWQLPWGAYP